HASQTSNIDRYLSNPMGGPISAARPGAALDRSDQFHMGLLGGGVLGDRPPKDRERLGGVRVEVEVTAFELVELHRPGGDLLPAPDAVAAEVRVVDAGERDDGHGQEPARAALVDGELPGG